MTTITNISPDYDIRNDLRFNVFTDDDLPRDTTSQWFDANEISKLKFRCRAWDTVARAGTAISKAHMIPFIANEFGLRPDDFTLSFSLKAGCSCGCSPGYVGKLKAYHGKLSRSDVWMKGIPLNPEDRAKYNAVCVKQTVKLAQEIYAHEHAAEIAATAEIERAKQAAKIAEDNARALSLSCAAL